MSVHIFGTNSHAQPGLASTRPLAEGDSPTEDCTVYEIIASVNLIKSNIISKIQSALKEVMPFGN